MSDNPILNSPYDEPCLHYATAADGSLDYSVVLNGRRPFDPNNAANPTRQPAQLAMTFEQDQTAHDAHIINLCRKEVSKWRNDLYPNTTRVTSELLHFWFANPDREAKFKLFFAQQESVETAIWLNEVAEKSNPGQNVLRQLRDAQKSVSEKDEDQLPRTAFKMATGSGKTVVMACFILYHFANRQEYRNDVRFADYFLVVAPGVTIKDRLGVLFVDTKSKIQHECQDYYRIRDLVPKSLNDRLQSLNSKLVVTNYHSFLQKTLQGNKKSPFDGKVDIDGRNSPTTTKRIMHS